MEMPGKVAVVEPIRTSSPAPSPTGDRERPSRLIVRKHVVSEAEEWEIKAHAYTRSSLTFHMDCPCSGCQTSPPPPPTTPPLSASPLLVADGPFNVLKPELPKRWRADPVVRVSASAQFSAAELGEIVTEVKSITAEKASKVVVVDLRLEPHGFTCVGGVPFSWYRCRNLAHFGKTTESALESEKGLLSELRTSELELWEVRSKILGSVYDASPIRLVDSAAEVESEADVAKKFGADYVRVCVLDHHHPSDASVDLLVNLFKSRFEDSASKWFHLHCRGGRGRSTTAWMMLDMMEAIHTRPRPQDLNMDWFLSRQETIGGSCLWKAPRCKNKSWKLIAMARRWAFLQDFWHFLLCGYKEGQSWSDWKNSLSAADPKCKCGKNELAPSILLEEVDEVSEEPVTPMLGEDEGPI